MHVAYTQVGGGFHVENFWTLAERGVGWVCYNSYGGGILR